MQRQMVGRENDLNLLLIRLSGNGLNLLDGTTQFQIEFIRIIKIQMWKNHFGFWFLVLLSNSKIAFYVNVYNVAATSSKYNDLVQKPRLILIQL